MIIKRMTIATLALFATAALSAAQAPQAPAQPRRHRRLNHRLRNRPIGTNSSSRHDNCADHGNAGGLPLSREPGTRTDANSGRASWCAGRLHTGGCGDACTDAAGTPPEAVGTSGTVPSTGNMYKVENIPDGRLKALVGKRVEVSGRIDPEDAGLGGAATQIADPVRMT